MNTLSNEQWAVLSPYLDEALDLPAEARGPWLAALREKSPALAGQVEMLLKEQSELAGKDFLETHTALAPLSAGLAGQELGVYTLISQIGHGGMGSVWLGRRNDGRFERQVAVKFLNIALMGTAAEERFQREGSIVGKLRHPNIAELLDAGISPTGQPYLVLEHIEGDHIDRYCDQKNLSVKERIRIFLEVLKAVAHAHSNLIVHRDIKPSNVLVRSDGKVKLLDFGVAKLLENEGGRGEATLTVEGGRALTPEYAAPEQLKGEPVTTATDVYALGMLLYVLLTGRHPIDAAATPAELVRAVLEKEPTRLSSIVLARGGEDASSNASRRGSTPERLSRALRGDLDTIVGKALKKDAEERYSSVSELSDDLRRYLRNLPINARPDTLAYRAVKFVRRNRTAVTFATVATLATLAGLAGTLVQTHRARQQRDFAFHQVNRADALNEFHEFLLSDAAPAGQSFTVNSLLDRAEDVLSQQSETDPGNRVAVLVSIGDQYSTQDQDAKARRVLEEAYKLSQRVPEVSTRAEAACVLAGALARDGEMDRAEALFQEGMRQIPQQQQYALTRILCLRRGSEVAQERGDSPEGIARMVQAQAILRASAFHSPIQEMRVSMDLAEANRMSGKNLQSLDNFEEAYRDLTALGLSNTQTAVTLFNNWAMALDRLGRPLEAEKLFQRALQIARTGQTEDAVSPMILNNYARTLRQLGRLKEAADYAERAYRKAEQVDNQVVLYQSLYLRTFIYADQNDRKRAEEMVKALEPRLRKSFSSNSYWFSSLASAQSLVAASKGDYKTASSLADQAVVMTEARIKSTGVGAEFLPMAVFRRTQVRLEGKDYTGALSDATRCIGLLQAEIRPGDSSAYVGRAYLFQGKALQALGKDDEAREAFQSAVENLRGTVGAENVDLKTAQGLAGAKS